MLDIEYTTQFKRDLKLVKRQGKTLNKLQEIMLRIQEELPLSPKLKDHPLTGNWNGHRELHIDPDWLLIYKINSIKAILTFVRTGSHSDLFK